VYQDRSGASEHDMFFFPQRRGDVATAAPGPAGRISAGLKASGSSAERALPSLDVAARRLCAGVKDTVQEQVEKLVSALHVLQTENQEAGATNAELEKILCVREETVQILLEQLAAARSELQALKAPAAGSQASHPSPGYFAGSMVVEDGSYDGEQTTPPARLRGLNPAAALRPFTPGKAITLTPKSADDVFGEASWSPSQGKGKKPVYTTKFEQKSLTELLSSCFNNVEAAIRKVPILDLLPRNDGRPTRDQSQVIVMLQEHLLAKKTAYELLKDEEDRYLGMIALISHTIVDYIFKDQIIGTTANFAGRTYLAAYEEEQKAADYDHPRIGDIQHRRDLAEQRASAARALARTPGFQKWLNSTTYGTTKKIVREFAICFPARNHYSLTQDLHKAVHEAVRIAVRMLQEPDFIEYSFPPLGTPWASDYHVHRNPELNGQTLSDDKSPYCVRVAIMPLIKAKSFANNRVDLKTIHKAEVIVGDRDIHLRQMHRKR
jgi:hypothetical protein